MRSRRIVFEKHLFENRHMRCPICRHALDCDHDDALKVHDVMDTIHNLSRVYETDPDRTRPPVASY